MSSFMDASARLHLMKHFEGDPTMQTIMEYGRMAQMTQDEVIRYLDIIGNKQWEAMKQQYGIKAVHGPSESSDEESNADKRAELLSHKIVKVKSEEKRLKKLVCIWEC
ncbi:unnamed protein product [Knipowitschia caucasica]|uniref:Uncharacterized protein n=1 Tax=Knipowitschia caucasica TaxID=637954 RepID=A0AAV2KT65_KNICA